MDDVEAFKIIALLMVNFLFSFTVSNYLSPEVDLVKSPVTSLKIFCSTYILSYVILTVMTAKKRVASSARLQENKGMFLQLTSILNWIGGIILFHCLAVLYGASILRFWAFIKAKRNAHESEGIMYFSFVEETFMWSIMMSNLVVLPCLLVGTEEIIKIIVTKRRSITLASCLCNVMALTIVGAWVGAFTLPLDWDRDWQVWPIPCAVGAMIGHSLSLVISGALLVWKYRNKNKNKFI